MAKHASPTPNSNPIFSNDPVFSKLIPTLATPIAMAIAFNTKEIFNSTLFLSIDVTPHY